MNKEEQIKKRAGKVVSGKVVAVTSPKTVVVAVESFHRHPIYRKAVRKTRKFLAHVEGVEVTAGEMVQMQEIPPVSKKKHYIIIGKVK